MNHNQLFELNLQSENFEQGKESKVSFEMNLTLNKISEENQEEQAEDQSNDTLFIQFKSQKPLGDDVVKYIEQTLGMFELIEK